MKVRRPLFASLCLSLAAVFSSQMAHGYGAQLVSSAGLDPGSAWAYYDALPNINTHTPGVADWGVYGMPPELLELANALGANRTGDTNYAINYANKVYEYIRNNIATEFRFGLVKGARGAVIDQSGTPFDQVHLMVSLLRLGNISASYQMGTISLTANQFGVWTGLVTGLVQSSQVFSVNARAACQFLVDGGIPATVNNVASCASLASSGNVATTGTPIVMGHIWVSANGQLYDPSFKLHQLKTGIDIAAAMNCGTNASQSCSSTVIGKLPAIVTNNGVATIQGSSTLQTSVDTQMQTYAKALQTTIQTSNASNATTLLVEDIVGGEVIDTSAAFAAGSSLPYPTSAHYTWSGDIPDPFRTTLKVQLDNINTTLYVDEYYGQRLRLFNSTLSPATTTTTTRREMLYLDTRPVSARSDYPIDTGSTDYTSASALAAQGQNLYLTVNHPYAANGGSYADEQQTYWIALLSSNRCTGYDCNSTAWSSSVVTIIQGWGDSTQSTVSHYAALARRDSLMLTATDPSNPNNIWPGLSKIQFYNSDGSIFSTVNICGYPIGAVSAQPQINPGCREEHQATMAATWLAETSRVWSLASHISQGLVQQHHTLGYFISAEAPTRFNLMSARAMVSANSSAAAAGLRQGLFNAAAQAANHLESGVVEQIFDSWEGLSSSSLLVKSNLQGYKFVELKTTNDIAAAGLTSYSTKQTSAIQNAVSGGSIVDVPQKGSLSYTIYYNNITYSYTGMIAENASTAKADYVAGEFTLGGGYATALDPAASALRSAEIVDYSVKNKSMYGVNLQSNALTLQPAADLVTGSGSFPQSLSFQRYYNSENPISAKDCSNPFEYNSFYTLYEDLQSEPEFRIADLGGGWTNNWSISMRAGTDGMAGLGRESALNASAVIAGLYVSSRINTGTRTIRERLATVFAANGWVKGLQNNVLTLMRGPKTDVFLRLPDGSFNPGVGSNERLVESGARSLVVPYSLGSLSTLWNFSGVTYNLTMTDGSTMAFQFGRAHVGEQSASVGFWVPQSWQFPSGTKLSFSYSNLAIPKNAAPTTTPWSAIPSYTTSFVPSMDYDYYLCLNSVSNTLGRTLTFGCTTTFSSVSDGTRTVSFASSNPGNSGSTNTAALCRSSSLTVTGADGQITKYDYLPKPTSATNREYLKIYQWFLPWDPNPFMKVGYDSLFRVKTLTDNSTSPAVTNYFSSGLYGSENQKRGDIQDAVGGITTKYFDANGNMTALIDPLGRATYNYYDSARRLRITWFPEKNSTEYTYDARHNLLTTVQHSKPGSGLPDIPTETRTYVEGPTVGTCVNQNTCNQVKTVTDSKNNQTTYDYLANGQLQRITGPLVTVAGVSGRAQTDYCYAATDGISLLRGKVEKDTTGSARVTDYTYADLTQKYVLQTATVDPAYAWVGPATAGNGCGKLPYNANALNLTTTFAFDGVGNVTSVADARGNTAAYKTTYYWDKMRRLTRVDSPLVTVNGISINPVTRYTYDTWGQLKSKRRRVTLGNITDPDPNIAWPDSGLVASDWQTEWREYYPNGDLKSITDAENHTTNYLYDKVGRQTLVTDAVGRRTATVYDLAGQTRCIWKAWDSTTPPSAWLSSSSTVCNWTPSTYASNGNAGKFRYVAYDYTDNGKQKWIQDANNNQTDYVYDKHDRARFTFYPDPSTGNRCTAPTGETGTPTCLTTGATYEELWYTADGSTGATRCSANDKPCRKRLRNGQTITYNSYDAMDRLITKTPQGQGAVSYGYNLLSQPTSISEAASGSYAAHTTAYTYDGAGRKGSETNDGRTVWYLYDKAGNRTRTVWPDNYYVTYDYDALNRMTYVKENGTIEIGFYDYDILSRRSKLRFAGNESNRSTYFYEADNDLDVLTQLMNTTTVTLDYGHNNAGQITGIAANDDFYLPKPTVSFSHAYVPDKLNRYSSVKGTAATYDNNGNLLTRYPLNGTTKDTFTYDSENRLVTAAVNGSSTATISYDYDALGRRVKKTVGTTVTQYLLDGDEEIAELNSTGTVLRRYITGPAIDDRIARAEGSAISNPTKTYYRTNHQGSVVATTDAAGTVTQRLAYDEYGLLGQGGVTSGEQFRYTGRRYDPETNLYYYRARYYAPDIGRFLQADPIGYKDDFNLYAYVGNDPLNKNDPSGLAGSCAQFLANNPNGKCWEADNSQSVAYMAAQFVIKNWPVSDSHKINVADKKGEGDGNFKTCRRGCKDKHRGIDIEGNIGDPIIAAGAGRVVPLVSPKKNDYGNQVIINHGNGIYSVYAHLDTIDVPAGTRVKAKDQVGTLGISGNTPLGGDPHLHFELRYGSPDVTDIRLLDPLEVLPDE